MGKTCKCKTSKNCYGVQTSNTTYQCMCQNTEIYLVQIGHR